MKPTKLSPTQLKIKTLLKPIVEGILKEEEGETGDFTPQELKLSRQLASTVASKIEWDGGLAGQVFLDALTECNFHSERTKLAPILSKVLGATYNPKG